MYLSHKPPNTGVLLLVEAGVPPNSELPLDGVEVLPPNKGAADVVLGAELPPNRGVVAAVDAATPPKIDEVVPELDVELLPNSGVEVVLEEFPPKRDGAVVVEAELPPSSEDKVLLDEELAEVAEDAPNKPLDFGVCRFEKYIVIKYDSFSIL